jgi:hypothetical protein
LDEKWLSEFTTSTSAGRTPQNQPLGLGKFHVLWPTVEDVRCSIEVKQRFLGSVNFLFGEAKLPGRVFKTSGLILEFLFLIGCHLLS